MKAEIKNPEPHKCSENIKTDYAWSRWAQGFEPHEDVCKICGRVLYEYGGNS